MIIKSRNEFGDLVLSQLENIQSNEKFKLIDRRLLNISNENDFDKILGLNEKILLLGDFNISIAEKFLSYCDKKENEACLILFGCNNYLLNDFLNIGYKAKNILIVGMRNLKREEIILIHEKNIRTVSMNDLNNNLEEVCDVIMEFSSGKNLYVSFNLNVLDPVFVPCLNSEIGGLNSRQASYIVSRMSLMKNLHCFEIKAIETNYDNLTLKLGAKILAEFL